MFLRSTTPSEGRRVDVEEVRQDPDRDEKAHPLWVCRCRRCGKATIPPATDHLLPVLVPTVHWQWAQVVASAIKLGPANVSEVAHGEDVAVQSCWLLPIHSWELALVAGNAHTWCVAKGLAKLWQLPNACRLTLGHPP